MSRVARSSWSGISSLVACVCVAFPVRADPAEPAGSPAAPEVLRAWATGEEVAVQLRVRDLPPGTRLAARGSAVGDETSFRAEAVVRHGRALFKHRSPEVGPLLLDIDYPDGRRFAVRVDLDYLPLCDERRTASCVEVSPAYAVWHQLPDVRFEEYIAPSHPLVLIAEDAPDDLVPAMIAAGPSIGYGGELLLVELGGNGSLARVAMFRVPIPIARKKTAQLSYRRAPLGSPETLTILRQLTDDVIVGREDRPDEPDGGSFERMQLKHAQGGRVLLRLPGVYDLTLVRLTVLNGSYLLPIFWGDNQVTVGCVGCRDALALPESSKLEARITLIGPWGETASRTITLTTPARGHGRNGRWDETEWMPVSVGPPSQSLPATRPSNGAQGTLDGLIVAFVALPFALGFLAVAWWLHARRRR